MLLQDEPKLKGRLCPQPSRLISMVSKTIYYLRFFFFSSFILSFTLFFHLFIVDGIFLCVGAENANCERAAFWCEPRMTKYTN